MREVVYLSEGKLRQFLPEHGRSWSWSHLGVRSPFVGVDLDRSAAASQQQLAAQLREVEKDIAKRAIPYHEASVPGMWVEFRTPLSYTTIEQEPFGDMVLFVQPATAAVPVAWGWGVRLLLHGSARHLLGRPPRPIGCDVSGATRVDVGRGSASEPDSFSFLVSNADMLSDAFGQGRVDPRSNGAPAGYSAVPDDYFGTAVGDFMSVVDEQLDPGGAAWMAGYARVTRFVKHDPTRLNYLVATPLYVMYSTPAPPVAGTRSSALENVEPTELPEG